MGANRPPSEGVECRLGSSIIKTASPKSTPQFFVLWVCFLDSWMRLTFNSLATSHHLMTVQLQCFALKKVSDSNCRLSRSYLLIQWLERLLQKRNGFPTACAIFGTL